MDIMDNLKKIGMFLIFAQIILHFCPEDKYIPYIRVILGIMVLMQVLKPVIPWIRVFL